MEEGSLTVERPRRNPRQYLIGERNPGSAVCHIAAADRSTFEVLAKVYSNPSVCGFESRCPQLLAGRATEPRRPGGVERQGGPSGRRVPDGQAAPRAGRLRPGRC